MKNQIKTIDYKTGVNHQGVKCYLCEDLYFQKGTQVRDATKMLEIWNDGLGWVTFRAVCNKHTKLATKYMRGDD